MADQPKIPSQPLKNPTVNPVGGKDHGVEHPGTFKPEQGGEGYKPGPGEKVQTPQK